MYAYVGNRPSLLSDPLGLASCCTCCCIDDLFWNNIYELGNGQAIPLGMWGYHIEAKGFLRWYAPGPMQSPIGRGCKFHWWEWTKVLTGEQANRGQAIERWQDWGRLWPDRPGWAPLRMHNCPDSKWITVADEPALNQVAAHADTQQDLYIGVQVISTPGCNCPHSVLTLKLHVQLTTDRAGLGDVQIIEGTGLAQDLDRFPDAIGKPPGPGW